MWLIRDMDGIGYISVFKIQSISEATFFFGFCICPMVDVKRKDIDPRYLIFSKHTVNQSKNK